MGMLFIEFCLIVVFSLTAVVVLYLLFFAVVGRLYSIPEAAGIESARHWRVAVLIPAYREDGVIVATAQAALSQAYPAACYDVVVIADSLQPATLQRLRRLPIHVIEVSFAVSTKAKALNAALLQLSDAYDIAVILDADNVMAPDFLTQVNNRFQQGWRVLQGHRTAKNTNTSVALLDAVSEEINNHIFRQGHRAVGLSAALIGSGMAFEYALLKNLMPEVEAVGGFDKELEMRLLCQRIRFGYLADAFVYDEKVENEAVFERQRTRWIQAQFKYLRLNFWPGLRALAAGNVDYADKVFQTLLPPRILLLGVLVMGLLLGVMVDGLAGHRFLMLFTAGQLLALLLTFYIALPTRLLRQIGPKELQRLPALFIRFLKSIYKMKTAKNQFLHTPHGVERVNL